MSGKATVLVVEDQSNWQDAMSRLLAEEGFEVLVAGSLPQAAQVLESRMIDVAIIDIRLEEGDITNADGIKFLDELEKYYVEDRAHALMLSGHGTVQLAVQALTRPSHNVLNFFTKETVNQQYDEFIREVERAARATREERMKRDRDIVSPHLPPAFVDTLDVPKIVSTMASDLHPLDAKKDFGQVLLQLLLSALPLARAFECHLETLPQTHDSVCQITAWSRKLVRPMLITMGRRGTRAMLEPSTGLGPDYVPEKMVEWTSMHFDGVRFDVPGVPFDRFKTVLVPETRKDVSASS